MHEFTFHFQVEKLVKALKDYYNTQGHSNTNTQSTGGGDTSQVKYFSICISKTDTVTFYTNTFNSGTSAESEKLQTFFLFLQKGGGGHFPLSSNLLVNLIETSDQVQYTPLLRPLLFGFYC